MTPTCKCVGEWRLVERTVDEDRVEMRFRWFITWRNPDCSWAHEGDA